MKLNKILIYFIATNLNKSDNNIVHITHNPRHAKLRCVNCNERGHIKKECRAPIRAIVCRMCGATGHKEPRCPNKICLRVC